MKTDKTKFGLYLLLFCLPLEALGLEFHARISISTLSQYIFVILAFFLIIKSGFDSYDKTMILFLYFSVLSLLWGLFICPEGASAFSFSERPELSWIRGPYHIFRFVYLFCVYKGVKEILVLYTQHDIYKFLKMLFIISIFIVLYGYYQMLGDLLGLPLTNINNLHKPEALSIISSQYIRLFSTFSEPKGYALFLVFAFPLVFVYLKRNVFEPGLNPLSPLLSNVLLFLILLSLLLTFSRGAFIAIFFTSILYLIIFAKHIGKYLKKIFIISIITGVAIICWSEIGFFYGTKDIIKEKIYKPFFFSMPILTSKSDYELLQISTLGRSYLNLKQSIYLLKESLLLGFGPGQFGIQSELRNWVSWKSNRPWSVKGPSSFLADLLGNLGSIGTFLMFFFVAKHIFIAKKQIYRAYLNGKFDDWARLQNASLFSTIVVWIQFLIQAGMYSTIPWLCLGLLAAVNKKRGI